MEEDQSESLLQPDEENEPMAAETGDDVRESSSPSEVSDKVKVKVEQCSDVTVNGPQQGAMSPRRLEVMRKLNFPADLLTLRQVEESEFLQTGIPWSVTSLAALPKGSTVGPYKGETVALSSIKPGELVLQFQGSDGDFSFIKVTEGTGSWLSLLRPADSPNSQNTQVIFENGRIWCEIIEDLRQGTELLASFTTHDDEPSAVRREKSVVEKIESSPREVHQVNSVPKKPEPKSVPQITPQPALIYGCPFCGVRFSSRRTLEAHLTYYCSKKPADFVNLHELHQQLQQQARAMLEKQAKQLEEESAHRTSPEQQSPRGLKRPNEGRSTSPTSSEGQTSDNDGRERKSVRTGEVYKCESCSYTTDRLSVLQKHQLQHSSTSDGRDSTEAERLSVSPMCQEETFCKECKIQFSSISTYKGHKEFYCRFRDSDGIPREDENVSEMASPGSKGSTSDLTLKLLQAQRASLESSSAFLTSKGHLHPALIAANPMLASPLLLQDIFMKSADQGEISKALTKPPSAITSPVVSTDISPKQPMEDQPLDLSKSKPDNDDVLSPTARKSSADINSESSMSPELPSPGKNHVNDGSTSSQISKTTLNIPSINPSMLLSNNQVQYVNKKPIPPLQSVSRCVECNIVFYKHENYLIHKEHYCSGRRSNKDSNSSDSDNAENDNKESDSTTSPKSVKNVESPSVRKTEVETKPEVTNKQPAVPTEICYKYYCIPCKIKFSSAGTLKAHKEFYCPHGKSGENSNDDKSERSTPNSSDGATYQCEHCKNEFNSARLLKLHICMGEMAPAPLLRCRYCDYVTQTENRLSEHMKVHLPTKAFKCNICGYRGNTARGMRMHGKMHVENGEEFTDDNMIEFEEPPVVPIQRNGVNDIGPIDVETELIRMKNEPYKRRRSRKSFEKSENIVPFLGQNMLTQMCAACGQTFTNVNDFVIHLRMHEIAALEAMKNLKSLQCEHCTEYVAESLTSLLLHMQTKHPEQLPGTSKCDLEGQSDGERSRSSDSRNSNDRSRSCSVDSSKMNINSSHDKQSSNSPPSVSAESQIRDDLEQNVSRQENGNSSEQFSNEDKSVNNDLKVSTQSHLSPRSEEDKRSKYSHAEKNGSPSQISPPSFQSLSREPIKSPQSAPPYLIKSEPMSPPHVRDVSKSVSPPKRSMSSPNSEKMSPKLMSPDPKTRYLLSQNNIKQEVPTPYKPGTPTKVSPPISPRTPIVSPKPTLPIGALSPKLPNIPLLYTPHGLLSPFHYPAGIPISLIPATALQASPSLPASASEKIGRKYCKHCDINFTYLSSFLTHKKYYCSARTSTEDSQSPTATA